MIKGERYEQIYNALITLKKLCSEIDSCLNCPLHIGDSYGCGLSEAMPEDWQINGVREWKAFE